MNQVILYLYDLSNGMAKQMSPALLGRQIDGIWHTGVFVFSTEYYYGGGICSGPPKQTPFGRPVREINLGTTTKDRHSFVSYLESIKAQFGIDSYDLFTNNCNNFTDVCSKWLLGEGIPSFIVDLPDQVLRTPLGQMIKPMVDGMTKQMNQQSLSSNIFNDRPGQESLSSSNLSQSQSQVGGSNNNRQPLMVTSIDQFIKVIEDNKAVIFDFYSDSCPPCRQIAPLYSSLSNQHPSLLFCKVDVRASQELAGMFEVSSIPFFSVYWKADEIGNFKGANESELKRYIQILQGHIANQGGQTQVVAGQPQVENKKNEENEIKEKKVFEFKLFNPKSKFNYYYDNDKLNMAYSKLQIDKSDTKTQSIITKLSNKMRIEKEEKTQIMNYLMCSLMSIDSQKENVMILIPVLDVVRYLVLDEQCYDGLYESCPELDIVLVEMLEKGDKNGNVGMLVTRVLVNLQKRDEKKKMERVTSRLTTYLSGQIKTSSKSRKQAEIMLVYNLVVNGYSMDNSIEYLCNVLTDSSQRTQEYSDDITRLGVLMLLSVLMHKDTQLPNRIKGMNLESLWSVYRTSQDQKVRMLLDDVMIVVHQLNN